MDLSIIYDPRSLDSVLGTSAYIAAAPRDESTIFTLVPVEDSARMAPANLVVLMGAPLLPHHINAAPWVAKTDKIVMFHNRAHWLAAWLGIRYVGPQEYSNQEFGVQIYGSTDPLFWRWSDPAKDPTVAIIRGSSPECELTEEFHALIRSVPTHHEYLAALWRDLLSMEPEELRIRLIREGGSLLRAEDAAVAYAVKYASSRLCLSCRNGWTRANGGVVAAHPLALSKTARMALALTPAAEVYVAYCIQGRQVYGAMAARSPELLDNLPVQRVTPTLGEFSVGVERFFSHWAA